MIPHRVKGTKIAMYAKNGAEIVVEIEISDIRGESVKSSVRMTTCQEDSDCESSNSNNNQSLNFSEFADSTASAFVKAFR